MHICYTPWNPRKESKKLLQLAESIISDYLEQGYTLTLRQLYYQFVAQDLIENSEKSYKNLGNLVNKGRLAGLISWTAIEDRSRQFQKFYVEENENKLIENLPNDLCFDYWLRQENYVEVWVEKEALGNVISRACYEYQVPYLACKGYMSSSETWRAGMRFNEALGRGKNCILIHLGDHDPSGLDMTRDNSDRIDLFTEGAVGLHPGVQVVRLALNSEQVKKYNPPKNPAKVTDSRFRQYRAKYGSSSWELDALSPDIIENLIKTEIETYLDLEMWEETQRMEERERRLLRKLANRWPDLKGGFMSYIIILGAIVVCAFIILKKSKRYRLLYKIQGRENEKRPL